DEGAGTRVIVGGTGVSGSSAIGVSDGARAGVSDGAGTVLVAVACGSCIGVDVAGMGVSDGAGDCSVAVLVGEASGISVGVAVARGFGMGMTDGFVGGPS